MNARNCVLLAATAAMLTACAAGTTTSSVNSNAKIDTPTVELRVNTTTDKLYVDTGPQNSCPAGARNSKGCIDTAEDDISFVTFVLRGAGNYSFKQMWICATATEPDPANPNCSLTDAQRKEFVAIVEGTPAARAPNAQGIIDLGDVRNFFFLNQNSFAETYYYLLEACTASGDCVRMDPRMRNGGRSITG